MSWWLFRRISGRERQRSSSESTAAGHTDDVATILPEDLEYCGTSESCRGKTRPATQSPQQITSSLRFLQPSQAFGEWCGKRRSNILPEEFNIYQYFPLTFFPQGALTTQHSLSHIPSSHISPLLSYSYYFFSFPSLLSVPITFVYPYYFYPSL